MKLEYAGLSETGAVRKLNEDAFLMKHAEHAALFLVADGVGGAERGDAASAALRDAYDRWWNEQLLRLPAPPPLSEAVASLKEVLREVNAELVRRYGEMRVGSTLVLLFLLGNSCAIISCGDSRLYCVRGLRFRQLTRDDTYENLQVKPEGTGEKDAGKLVSAVGFFQQPEFTVRTEHVERGMRFFLCSDGVYRYVPPGTLKRRLLLGGRLSAPEGLLASLSAVVERNGAGDNYSMIFVRVLEGNAGT